MITCNFFLVISTGNFFLTHKAGSHANPNHETCNNNFYGEPPYFSTTATK